MKKIIGIILIIIGIILPFYILINGIVQLVNGISPFIASEVIWGVCKIIFCGIGIVPFCFGYYILAKAQFDEF